MINKELLEKAKQTSFVAHLTDKEIVQLLHDCGYVLDIDIYGETDGKRKPITRTYDSRNRKVVIEVCAVDTFKRNVMNAMARKIPILNLYSRHVGAFNTSLIIIRDYQMYDLFVNKEDPFKDKFTDLMLKKFGDRYRIAYNKWATRYNNRLEKEQIQDEEPCK